MRAALLDGVRSLLCIGAHCDDIEIGCGGAVLSLIARNPGLSVTWLVFTSDDVRAAEARASADRFLSGADASTVEIQEFRERYLPHVAIDVKERFDRLGTEIDPDLILTHHSADLHQDHRVLSELTYNTFRDHLILEYEIPKYDGDLGRPNVFVHLDAGVCEQKIEMLLEEFPSQRDKHWFTAETFRAILTIRGLESRAPSGFAEGFHCRKLVLA
jgi:LmbE family N-acetylglucosaminyl deacetylase